ncbi:helix-turn-helix domain-containing protein [Latilactobacillus curvatus]|uniref:helix-turn-helix domain-containing protein n=1 Tax=Latilactobacillus curvatus TaxID=28038 RepID=UPI0020732526|nr:helix-turn-helix transcriptional regulator [Latilactobacillus curvatus]MCM6843998.1 helix-turn-helix domain-containing protein [Latilactobacillus curvatus]MCM6861115.1 helix-turn-helix domain-containing protein [Latilactobacillus curvatus]MCM6868413.1 helix-turn-helix domain-containing protein [Latilactobacillus curvatus]
MSKLSERLTYLRESKGWSKTLVVKKLGLKNLGTYANYEYGTREPDMEIIVKLAKLYEVTTDYLLGNTDNPAGNIDVKQAEITDDQVIMTFEGKPIPEEDLDLIKRLLRGKE